MMLALVNNERQMRRDLRMVIRPLSDEFIHGSPEELPVDCYRLEPRLADEANRRLARLEQEGVRI